jgi:hypothetical protein
MLSDLHFFAFAFALLEYRYLRVDSYTYRNGSTRLKATHPAYYHYHRLKADRHL